VAFKVDYCIWTKLIQWQQWYSQLSTVVYAWIRHRPSYHVYTSTGSRRWKSCSAADSRSPVRWRCVTASWILLISRLCFSFLSCFWWRYDLPHYHSNMYAGQHNVHLDSRCDKWWTADCIWRHSAVWIQQTTTSANVLALQWWCTIPDESKYLKKPFRWDLEKFSTWLTMKCWIQMITLVNLNLLCQNYKRNFAKTII